MPDMKQLANAALAERMGMSQGMAKKAFQLDYFSYSHSYIPLNGQTTSDEDFRVQADSGFVIVKTMFTISDTNDAFITNISDTPRYVPLTVIWTDTGSGRDVMDAAQSLTNVCGTGERPYYWPKPKVLDPNSTFVGKVTNLVATVFRLRVTFSGFKVFGMIDLFKEHLGVK